MANSGEEQKVVKLEWEEIEALPTVYANNVAVTHASGDEFYLIFGEAAPPTEMFRRGTVQRIPIRPVAKIAVFPGSMLRIARAIYQNAQNFLEKTRTAEEEDAPSTTLTRAS